MRSAVSASSTSSSTAHVFRDLILIQGFNSSPCLLLALLHVPHNSPILLDGYQFHNFYSSSSNHRLDITLLRLQRHCLVPRRRHPGCESTHCEGNPTPQHRLRLRRLTRPLRHRTVRHPHPPQLHSGLSTPHLLSHPRQQLHWISKIKRLKEELAPRSTRDVHASCVVTRHQATQYDSSTDCCLDQRRTSLRDLVSSLRTTIVAEATELRTEKMSCDGSKENTVEKWIVQNSKNGPIKVKTRYDILFGDNNQITSQNLSDNMNNSKKINNK
ncbi:hypothetical protein J6590_073977 [Homalodisca vitripennis]|nr:hypothetical protein J6590_073977 [Homalodisca vitripennis]